MTYRYIPDDHVPENAVSDYINGVITEPLNVVAVLFADAEDVEAADYGRIRTLLTNALLENPGRYRAIEVPKGLLKGQAKQKLCKPADDAILIFVGVDDAVSDRLDLDSAMDSGLVLAAFYNGAASDGGDA